MFVSRILLGKGLNVRLSLINRQQVFRTAPSSFLIGNRRISHINGSLLRCTTSASQQIRDFSDLKGRNNRQKYAEMPGFKWTVYIMGAGMAFVSLFCYGKQLKVDAKTTIEADDSEKERPDLPTYTAEEVAVHDSVQNRVWVTYRSGVYDITDFLDRHPGGSEKVAMAAGGSVEPFWLVYAFHQKPEILEMLEKYRIGNLDAADVGQAVLDLEDPYAADPRRLPVFRVRSEKPFNAEPPTEILVDSYITPNDLFFVRNHLAVPTVDESRYRLTVSGIGMKTVSLSLQELESKFRQRTVTATLQCAGNRRDEMNKVKQVKGLEWGNGAISTATWTGVELRDILHHAGLTRDSEHVKHVQFEGLDTSVTGESYGASIPFEKAMDKDVIVATRMNGEPIPADHGYPVRVVVPGTIGARSVKWLSRIVASDTESPSFWQQKDYKLFSPNVDWDTVDFGSTPALQGSNVQGVICDPAPNSTVKVSNGSITVRGYAFSGDGRKIVRVDVTTDGGNTWRTADLRPDNSSFTRAWSWTLWSVKVPVDESEKEIEVACRAVDYSGNVQPERVDHVWNLRGVMNNAWHRVRVDLAAN